MRSADDFEETAFVWVIEPILYEDKGDVGNKKPDNLSKCKIIKKGNLVINSMNYSIGSYGMSEYDGVCSPVYIVLDPDENVVHRRFALRIFENSPFQKYLATFGNGILAHRAAIGWDDIKGAYIPVPPKEDQLSILNFLDHETAKIDTLIDKQQQLIKLLKEKRQAVISHAVTKGLNPDAPMKDSGVEWLGEVPEHWKVTELRFERKPGTSITYGIVQAGPHIEGGIPYIKTSDMSGESLPIDGYSRTSAEIDESYSRSKVYEGDLVISIRASVGKCHILPKALNGANLTQGTAKISPGKELDRDFLYSFMNSTQVQLYLDSMAKGATFKEITLDMLRRTAVPVPPMSEQKAIASLIKGKSVRFDQLVFSAEKAVSLMQERRTALISTAVTGKIDVRNWQPAQTKIPMEASA